MSSAAHASEATPEGVRVKCLCCHQTFAGLEALARHRAADGRDEGETWVEGTGRWSHA